MILEMRHSTALIRIPEYKIRSARGPEGIHFSSIHFMPGNANNESYRSDKKGSKGIFGRIILNMEYQCWKAMRQSLTEALTNIRGGLTGVLVYIVVTVLVYFAAFMAALGNDTPAARLVLAFAETYAIVAYPLWAIPLSYILGGCFLNADNPGKEDIGRG
jgi:hypothetical protein